MIVSAVEHAANVDHPVARFEAVGTALRGRPSWDQFDDSTTMAARDAGAHLWERTDLKPGRRRRRRALRRLQLPRHDLARGARASAARARAARSSRAATASPATASCRSTPTAASCRPAGSTASASSTRPCLQLRGEAGERQVPKDVEVAAVANGGGPIAGALLLSRLAVMAFDQDDLVALPRPHRGRARGRRGPEPRHRLPPGLRRPDPRPGPHRRRPGVARQVGEVAPHPVPPRGRHGQADALPGRRSCRTAAPSAPPRSWPSRTAR